MTNRVGEGNSEVGVENLQTIDEQTLGATDNDSQYVSLTAKDNKEAVNEAPEVFSNGKQDQERDTDCAAKVSLLLSRGQENKLDPSRGTTVAQGEQSCCSPSLPRSPSGSPLRPQSPKSRHSIGRRRPHHRDHSGVASVSGVSHAIHDKGSIRVRVLPNGAGSRTGGKIVRVRGGNWNTFLSVVGQRLGFSGPARRVYLFDGGQIEDLADLNNGDVLFATANENETFRYPGAALPSDWITLNVGGQIFSTTRSTLTQHKGSVLCKMFSEEWENFRDRDGSILIDRSPEYWTPVLHFLRYGVLVLDDGVNPIGVAQEAKFWGLEALTEKLKPLVEASASIDALSRREFVRALIGASTNSSLRCQGIDLHGINLSNLDLSHINFRRSNFRGADLSGATMDYCLMQGAILEDVDLSNASLRGVYLGGANLTRASLKGANMEDRGGIAANLEGVSLREVNLEDGNLCGTDLRAANLKGANLSNCNLLRANLAGADLEGADLRGANLNRANLVGCNLRGAHFDVKTVSSRGPF